MPIWGTTIVERKIVEWVKSPGEKVNKGDTILVIESDKANIDLEVFNSGYLAVILAQAGETVTCENPVVGLIAETEAELPLAQLQGKLRQKKLAAETNEIPDLSSYITSFALPIPSIRFDRQIDTATLDNFYIENKLNGLTMTGLLAKVVARALIEYPVLNAILTAEGIKYHSQIDINMSVYLTNGKTVFPTLLDVAKKDLRSLSLTCLQLADRAIKNRLKPQQYNRSSITIMNLAMLGVDRFDTALFESQSCTITFGAVRNSVVMNDLGLFGIRKQMNVSLIGDRRLLDRTVGEGFLQDLAEIINDKDLLSKL